MYEVYLLNDVKTRVFFFLYFFECSVITSAMLHIFMHIYSDDILFGLCFATLDELHNSMS